VHNGIIDNYEELRQELSPKHHFASETDTEVICHLLEDHLQTGDSLEEAVRKTAQRLQGSYALAIVWLKEPHKIVALKIDTPLLVGIGHQGFFVASDAFSIFHQTKEVIYLDDGEIAVLSPEGIYFLNSQGERIAKQSATLTWSWGEGDKGEYEHFMLKEIMEAPQAIHRALQQDDNLILEMALDILRARQVVLTACGTSRYAALVGRYLFSKLGKRFSEVVMASEFHYFADAIDRNTLVLAISQSGETADVLQGVKLAKEAGAIIFSLLNVPGSTLARLSDKVIHINCGPEVCVAATKSFISQLVVFYLLSHAMVNRLPEAIKELTNILAQVEKQLPHNAQAVQPLISRFKDKENWYLIARGINFAIASEGALKMKEVAYIHAEGMPAGELKHGTLALIEPGVPVVVVCPQDYTFSETLANALEAKSRGGYIIGISNIHSPAFDYWIPLPSVTEVFSPLVTVLPLQLLAYHLAVARGKDPDKPRNLAKSVTVK
jgi:glucosamine--fructose-6-phosphate aminotransferase (isomerizing)